MGRRDIARIPFSPKIVDLPWISRAVCFLLNIKAEYCYRNAIYVLGMRWKELLYYDILIISTVRKKVRKSVHLTSDPGKCLVQISSMMRIILGLISLEHISLSLANVLC